MHAPTLMVSKTQLYTRYAREQCGVTLLDNVCKGAPNGYEPRFDGEGIGADKHFPRSPCIAGAWSKFEMMTVADKRTFAQEQSLLHRLLQRPCIDRDDDVKRESNGTAPNCTTQVNNCQSAEIGEVVRTYCPKTCGVCTPGHGSHGTAAPSNAKIDEESDLQDLITGKQAGEEQAGSWTLTPRSLWTRTPTVDSSCFANPEQTDCFCLANKRRGCRNKSGREESGLKHPNGRVYSVTECEHFYVCTHSQTCPQYKDRHCTKEAALARKLQAKIDTC